SYCVHKLALLRIGIRPTSHTWTTCPSHHMSFCINIINIYPGQGGLKMSYPFGLSAIYHPSPIVRVHLSRCRDTFALPFSETGGHYFVTQLRQYLKHPGLSYSKSALRNYYDTFQPS